MNKLTLLFTLTGLILCLNIPFTPLLGQTPIKEVDSAAIRAAVALYYASPAVKQSIYNGPVYVGYAHPAKVGHPFFQSADKLEGTVKYQGLVFNGVSLLYDVVQDQPLVLYPDGNLLVALHSDFVDYFTMPDGHRFVRIDSVRAAQAGIDKGFYDEIYKGQTTVVVKRSKSMLRRTDGDGIWTLFSGEKRKIYLLRDGKFIPVSSQGSALNAFGGFRDELALQLRNQKIKFKKSPEQALKLMAETFDRLSKGS